MVVRRIDSQEGKRRTYSSGHIAAEEEQGVHRKNWCLPGRTVDEEHHRPLAQEEVLERPIVAEVAERCTIAEASRIAGALGRTAEQGAHHTAEEVEEHRSSAGRKGLDCRSSCCSSCVYVKYVCGYM